VIDHLGGIFSLGELVGRRDELWPRWRADIAALSRLQNTYPKLSGLARNMPASAGTSAARSHRRGRSPTRPGNTTRTPSIVSVCGVARSLATFRRTGSPAPTAHCGAYSNTLPTAAPVTKRRRCSSVRQRHSTVWEVDLGRDCRRPELRVRSEGGALWQQPRLLLSLGRTHAGRARHGATVASVERSEVRQDCGPADALLANGREVLRFGDIEVLALRTQRGLFAVENRCPHLGRQLSDAAVLRRRIVCAGHGLAYDLASGKPANRPPRSAQLRVFDIAIEDGRILLSPKAHKATGRLRPD
jgi:nitrite reductase/ring-hydroxylating ferredoxin subunit